MICNLGILFFYEGGKGLNKKTDWKTIAIIAGIVVIYFFMRVKIVPTTVFDEIEMLDVVSDAIVHNKSTIYFTSEVSPDALDYELILGEVIKKDLYSGGEFYEYKYTYKINSDGNYRVKFKVNKPRWYRKHFAKRQIKKIAKIYGGLGSDYEKIKAVHDYICSYNAYQRISGGAYMTICSGNAACNGYGLTFYLVMKEMGIPVTYEVGADHMWNKVMVDGKWYNIDLTWDDPDRGGVIYDYFLKSDKNWYGHEHGGADAENSLPISGLSAKEYYKMMPNHKIERYIILFFVAVIVVIVVYYLSVIVPRKKRLEKQKAQELLEKSIRQSREMMRLDNQFDDHNDIS